MFIRSKVIVLTNTQTHNQTTHKQTDAAENIQVLRYAITLGKNSGQPEHNYSAGILPMF